MSLSPFSSSNVTSTITVTLPGASPGGGGGYTAWWFASGVDSVLVIASDPTGLARGTWVNVTATPFSVLASPAKQDLTAGSTATLNLNVFGSVPCNDT